MDKSSRSFRKTFRERAHMMRDTVANELRRRLWPNTGVTRAHLAHAIGCNQATVDNWLAGNVLPAADHLMSMFEFFDSGFANAVMGERGCIVAKLSDVRRVKAMKAIEKFAPLVAALDELSGAAA